MPDLQCLEEFSCHLQGVPQWPLPVTAQCATNPALMLEKPCSLLPAQSPPRSCPVASESHRVQSWGTKQSEIQFSWWFFTWIQLPIGFMRNSHECLYWNTVEGNWRWERATGKGWEGIKWLWRWGLGFSASPAVWKLSNSIIKKWNRKWLTFQI